MKPRKPSAVTVLMIKAGFPRISFIIRAPVSLLLSSNEELPHQKSAKRVLLGDLEGV